MPVFTQVNQPIEVITALGKDALLITSFHGQESLSHLFHFHVEMIADSKKEIAFDKILGQKVTIRLNQAVGKIRYFNGICNRFSQGEGDADFTAYHLEFVPQFWLLTKRANTRIFQQKSVPDILKKVLEGLDVVFQIEGTFQPRNYCVQYRETDFNFASRLMEEEGIFYFFTHTADGHKMVLANSPASHPDMPLNNKLIFEKNVGSEWKEDRVLTWQKQQELMTGQHTVWDHKFEMHGKNLEAKKTLVDSIQVGKATHKLKAGGADSREVYDYPGDYANRFDGINPGGGDQAAELKKILQDNERVVSIRSQQEAILSMRIEAVSSCRNLFSGHKFSLQRHGSGDGDYVITSIRHQVTTPIDYTTNSTSNFRYSNAFTSIPFALPFRPQRETPKPFVQGTQTAIVVGPPGEEIFCDKYSRVKVQFHWDREGKFDAKSSCWIRVATNWAGKGWGTINIPRIGHEVLVAFEEGDPDLPIIVGSVYNADHMPPGDLPTDKVNSGLKSNSTPGGGGYNGMVCNDTKGKEKITVHAQHDMDTTVEHNNTHRVKVDENWTVNNNRTAQVDVDDSETIGGNQTKHVKGNRTETVDTNESITIHGKRTEVVDGAESITINAKRTENVTAGGEEVNITGATGHKITGNFTRKVEGTYELGATTNIHTEATSNWEGVGKAQASLQSPKVFIHGDNSVQIESGGSSIVLTPSSIVLSSGGGQITLDASGVTIVGTIVKIN